jgi:hypothetical protein
VDTILGILPGESYSNIRALADLSVCILIIPIGAYELIELDKYAMLLALRCLNG